MLHCQSTLENIEASAAYFRTLFKSDEYLERPHLLGPLGIWSDELAFETWEGTPTKPTSWEDVLVQATTPYDRPCAFDASAKRDDVEAFLLMLDKVPPDRPALQ